jgi:UDP-glucose 6-dehydrogenase|tara:strand:+ start:488 stop:661 length:174 start_codon:yes stop_codon:yes gene_type:complete
MRITIFGSGHVGLVTRVCLAELGNQVTYIDEDKLMNMLNFFPAYLKFILMEAQLCKL